MFVVLDGIFIVSTELTSWCAMRLDLAWAAGCHSVSLCSKILWQQTAIFCCTNTGFTAFFSHSSLQTYQYFAKECKHQLSAFFAWRQIYLNLVKLLYYIFGWLWNFKKTLRLLKSCWTLRKAPELLETCRTLGLSRSCCSLDVLCLHFR